MSLPQYHTTDVFLVIPWHSCFINGSFKAIHQMGLLVNGNFFSNILMAFCHKLDGNCSIFSFFCVTQMFVSNCRLWITSFSKSYWIRNRLVEFLMSLILSSGLKIKLNYIFISMIMCTSQTSVYDYYTVRANSHVILINFYESTHFIDFPVQVKRCIFGKLVLFHWICLWQMEVLIINILITFRITSAFCIQMKILFVAIRFHSLELFIGKFSILEIIYWLFTSS